MSTKLKICGITSWADAKRAVEAGADMLGFNFYGASPRYIPVSIARRIARRLPRKVKAVGIFVNEEPQVIEDISRTVGLHAVQLHGGESPQQLGRLPARWRVIKAFRVRRGFNVARLRRYARAHAFLLDGFSRIARGGTGKTFDWALARRAKRYGRVILAGGITPDNVAEAIEAARPYAVDVCSGVETFPGKKDPKKLRALGEALKKVNAR